MEEEDAIFKKTMGYTIYYFSYWICCASLIVVLYYAFTDGQGKFTGENFENFFTNTKTLGTLFYSFLIALATTAGCLLIAYPTAFILARGHGSGGM